MTSQARARKLADRIKEIVAQTLELRIKDPRLGFVTITEVRVTPDLREASVFYTVLGDQHERDASAAALASAKGVLRSEVGKQTGIKFTPSLAFYLDAVPQAARHVEDLLVEAARADAAVHEQAQGASFAGEPDPYRHPRVDDDGVEDDGVEVDRAEDDVDRS